MIKRLILLVGLVPAIVFTGCGLTPSPLPATSTPVVEINPNPLPTPASLITSPAPVVSRPSTLASTPTPATATPGASPVSETTRPTNTPTSPPTTTNTPNPTPTITSQPTRQTVGLTLPDGYEASVVIRGLQGPTQMIIGPDERLWLAQLAGDENAGQGQVVAFSLTTSEQRVLLTGLFKPTGIAILANALWIAAGRDLLRAPLSQTGEFGPVETILKDLPFNGRSEGTLTVSPVGRLIFETSGQRSGNQAIEGSAKLWELDPADPTDPRPIAIGLKNAYAHTFDAAGRLWTTDVLDDPVNGEAPPDELNLVVESADFGWPPCFGYQQPALNYGGSQESCRTTRPPVVLFPPHSTPTSVVVSPWEENILLVALWGPPVQAIMRVPYTLSGDNAVGQAEPFITGLQNPQHLLLWLDDSLLVSDSSAGVIYRISRSSSN